VPINILSIGIDQLRDEHPEFHFPDLRYAASDATFFLRGIRRKCDVGKHLLITDSTDSPITPSRSNIIAALQSLSVGKSEEVPLIIYYVGHGISYENHFHICPSDYRSSIRKYSAISLEIICEILRNRNTWTVLVFDCCRRHLESDHETSQVMPKTLLTASEEMGIILSCSKEESAIETNKNRSSFGGVFSHYFAQQIFSSKAHSISLNQAFENARDKTAVFASTHTSESQTPMTYGASISNFHLIAKK
jgi:hypothetical protein